MAKSTDRLEEASVALPQSDVGQVIRILWSKKWWVSGITAAFAVLAATFSLTLPDIYRSEALLSPNNKEATGGLSSLIAQYGGLASMAGINLGQESTDDIAVGLQILQSRVFLTAFIDRHNLLVPIMAAKDWDSKTGRLVIDDAIYDSDNETWVRKESGKPAKPSLLEAYERLTDDFLIVAENKRTSFISVAVDYYSPDIAQQWVSLLVQDLNQAVMEQDVREAEQAIEFLERQIAATSIASLQEVFFALIEEQTKTVMLAEISDEYLLVTLDPAIIPEEKRGPSRSLIVLLGLIVGALAATAVTLGRELR
ncbi:MAG: Wzz/FepE/Etk N-terminal domain-containing protein [Pseudomonadota bacterium]